MVFHRCFHSTVLGYVWMAVMGYCQQFCPRVAVLNTEHEIVANVTASGFTDFSWANPESKKVSICSPVCQDVYDSHTGSLTDNNTGSILKILNVSRSDTGMWTLIDQHETPYNVCHLITAKKPRCSINSDKDANDLDLGNELTLTLSITGAHCSQTAEFSLTIGDVTTMLENVTDSDVSIKFQVDIQRFGDVSLIFSCENNWKLFCEGVKKLMKSRPQCNISSSISTDDLDLGDDVTLTSDIRGYYCPQPAEFSLIIGNVTERFPQTSIKNITDLVLTSHFKVISTRLGHVALKYTCDGISLMLACDGVTTLTADVVPTPASPASPDIIIIVAVVGGVILLLILIAVIVKRRKVRRVAKKYIVQRGRRQKKTEKEEMKTENEEMKTKNEEMKTENEEKKTEKEKNKTENEEMKTENEEIKTENEEIKTENEEIKTENEEMKTEYEEMK